MIGYEPTMAQRVRYIGYGLSGMTLPGDPGATPPAKVTVPSEALGNFDTDLQNVADDMDDWSVKLHDRFRDLSMSFIEVGRYLGYEVSVKKKSETT